MSLGVGPGDATSFDFFLTLRDLVMKLDITDFGRLCFLLIGLAVPCGARVCRRWLGDSLGNVSWFDQVWLRGFFGFTFKDDVDFDLLLLFDERLKALPKLFMLVWSSSPSMTLECRLEELQLSDDECTASVPT